MTALKVNENQGATVINMPKKKAYTQIPNEILEKLYSPGFHLPGEQRAVFDFILRKTLGWGRESDRISRSQIAEATGLKHPNVSRAIRILVEKRLLVVSNTLGCQVKTYGINENIEEWKPELSLIPVSEQIPVSKPIPVSKTALTRIKIDTEPVSTLIPTKEIYKETITKEKTYSSDFCKSGGSEFDSNQVFIPENLKNISIEEIESSIPQEPVIPESLPAEKPKSEKSKRETCLSVIQAEMFARFWDLYPRHRRKEKPKAEKAFKFINPDESLFAEIMAGLQAAVNSSDWQKDNGQFVCYPERFLKNQKWTDEYDSGKGFKKAGCPMTNYMTPKDLEAEAAKYADLLPDPEDWLK